MHRAQEQGITLIALVITIIVLLILAGVTVGLMIGDNGILSRAKQAKEESQRQSIFEEIRLAISDYTIGVFTDDTSSFIAYLEEVKDEIKGIEEIAKIEIENEGGTVKYEDRCYTKIMGKWYTVYANGEIEEGKIVWDGSTSESLESDSDGAYLVSSAADLSYLAQKVNSGENYEGVTFKLTSSIDLGARVDIHGEWIKGLKEWIPIGRRLSDGSEPSIFSGTFDGQNNSIRGIYRQNADEYSAIFGNSDGTIKNVEVKYNYSSGYVAASLVGNNKGTVENCCSTGAGISSILDEEGATYGGIVGVNREQGKIINCYNSGEIIIQGDYSNLNNGRKSITMGGISYSNMGEIENCYNSGNLKNTSTLAGLEIEGDDDEENQIDFSIAGIAYFNIKTVKDCYNKGDIILEQSGNKSGLSYSAGIVVFNGEASQEGKLENCYNIGNIINESYSEYTYVGGIASYNQAKGIIMSCYNSGTITNNSVGYSLTAGISGQNTGDIESCYNTGTISGSAKGISTRGVSYGGINGNTYSTAAQIINCYNTGKFEINLEGDSDDNPIYIGGVVGFLSSGTVQNCYYLDTIAAGGINKSGSLRNSTDIAGATENKSESEMKTSDFVNLLDPDNFKLEENSFPILKWQ